MPDMSPDVPPVSGPGGVSPEAEGTSSQEGRALAHTFSYGSGPNELPASVQDRIQTLIQTPEEQLDEQHQDLANRVSKELGDARSNSEEGLRRTEPEDILNLFIATLKGEGALRSEVSASSELDEEEEDEEEEESDGDSEDQ